MGSRARLDVFCEDVGHELFVRALIARLAGEGHLRVDVQTRNSRGGHGRALTELKTWQRLVRHGAVDRVSDILVLVIDGNCNGWNEARRGLMESIDRAFLQNVVIGCPDPHVERWYMADPPSFRNVVGAAPLPDPGKCDRGIYKRLLRESIVAAGQPILSDPAELAPDLVRAMDLFRAGKNQSSLRHFVDDLRKAIRSFPTPAAPPRRSAAP